jgi:hypothetical protein
MSVPPLAVPAFALPHNGLTYIEEVLGRCRDLIQCGVWAGLHAARLRRWLTNFRTDEEKYFAACILDNLIYRSEQQTVSLIRQLLQRTLADLTRQDPTPLGAVRDWLTLLRTDPRGTDPRLRLVALVQRDDPPTKSAHVIARLMKRYLHINESWIITPWSVSPSAKKGTQVFVYIDDFLGTGDQFSEIVGLEKLGPTFDATYSAYAPLAAHVRGITTLRNSYPHLRVAPVEVLSEDYSLFSPKSLTFDDGVNTPEAAERFYSALVASRGITLYGCDRRGYGGLELAYTFSHGVADNCLPILWYPHSADWQPLLDR